jgi:protein-tyrosine phosphatase
MSALRPLFVRPSSALRPLFVRPSSDLRPPFSSHKPKQKKQYFCKSFHFYPLDPILSTQLNFRDLGGIQTTDGWKVKPGLLFRSGDFFTLSADDILMLEGMKLATIIDLRAQREIDRRPDKLIGSVKEIIHIDIHDAARDKAEKFLEENDAEGLETVLIHDYIRMVTVHQHDFRRFLEILAGTGNLPLVYHCAAGKDRTGLATVFLLTALGVDLEHIREDYMATNIFTESYTQKIIRKVTESGLNGEILRPLLEVRKDYLDAGLTEIERLSGGLELFVRYVLKADCETLQDKYLTN